MRVNVQGWDEDEIGATIVDGMRVRVGDWPRGGRGGTGVTHPREGGDHEGGGTGTVEGGDTLVPAVAEGEDLEADLTQEVAGDPAPVLPADRPDGAVVWGAGAGMPVWCRFRSPPPGVTQSFVGFEHNDPVVDNISYLRINNGFHFSMRFKFIMRI